MKSAIGRMSITLLSMVIVSSCKPEGVSVPDFKSAVNAHLKTVETRNFEAFRSTLTSTSELSVIFPNGTMLKSTQDVLDFHEEWFKDENWVFNTNIVKVIRGSDQSTALIKYNFRDAPDGEPRRAWLVLTFQLENNEWRLIHDQNTRIDK